VDEIALEGRLWGYVVDILSFSFVYIRFHVHRMHENALSGI